MAEIILDDSNFEAEVLNSDIPVLVDFWAPWCGPCEALGPIISAIAEKYEGKIKVGKYNAAEADEYAEKFGVERIPYIKIFKAGEVVSEQMGFAQQPAIEALIEEIL